LRGAIVGHLSQFTRFRAPAAPSTLRQAGRRSGMTALETSARRNGRVRVIVQLSPPLSTLESASAERRYALVHQAQERVLNDLGVDAAERAVRLTTLPYLALTVTARELQMLARHPGVISIHEDRLLGVSWQENHELIGAPIAWQNGYDGAGQTIAILDTGVASQHPMLAGKVVAEACFSAHDPELRVTTTCPNAEVHQIGPGAAAPCDATIEDCAHGSHVAGIAAGQGEVIRGVAHGAHIIAIQVFHVIDSPTRCSLLNAEAPCIGSYSSSIIQALEHIYALRDSWPIAAVNLSLSSLGVTVYGTCDDEPTEPFIAKLRAAGIATIVAAGNDGQAQGLSAPACAPSAISVGAVSDGSRLPPDLVSTFSNSSSYLDLLAPGEDILSAALTGGYMAMSGTSMAAPHVAGGWTLLRQKYPDATIDDLYHLFVATGTGVFDTKSGLYKPRIRLSEALTAHPQLPVIARLYDADSGRLLQSTPLAPDYSFRFDALPKGRYLVTALLDNNQSLWHDPGELSGVHGALSQPDIIAITQQSQIATLELTLRRPILAGDNSSQASAAHLLLGSLLERTAEANLSDFDSWHYYQFAIPERGSYLLETLGNGCKFITDYATTRLELLSADGELLAVSQPANPWDENWCASIPYTFEAGRYYLRVASTLATHGRPYILTLRQQFPVETFDIH
jgi:subtilisin family serine protease